MIEFDVSITYSNNYSCDATSFISRANGSVFDFAYAVQSANSHRLFTVYIEESNSYHASIRAIGSGVT